MGVQYRDRTMRTVFIISCVIAVASAQFLFGLLNKDDDVVDRLHEYRIEYHHSNNYTHFLIAIKDDRANKDNRECHIIEIDKMWEPLLNDTNKSTSSVMRSIHLYQMQTHQ